jgi:predicted outer membrane repeat protein
VSKTTLSGNSAGADGGGIFNSCGVVTVSNCRVTGNTAGSHGGGIYTTNGTLTLVGNNDISHDAPDNVLYA